MPSPIDKLTTKVTNLQTKVEQLQKSVGELPGKIRKQAEQTRTAVDGVPENLVKTVREKAQPLLMAPFIEALREIFDRITQPLRDLLSPVLDLLQLARLLKDEVLEVEKRLDYVTNTLRFLFPGAGKQLEEIRDAFKALLEPGDTPKDLLRLIVALLELNPTYKTMIWITECAFKREFTFPDRPAGFYPGRLYEFIHAPELSEGEREFRLELVGAVDRYFRGPAPAAAAHQDGATTGPLAGVDGELALKSLTDLVGILIQTSLGFIFRPPHLPSRIAPRMRLLRPAVGPSDGLARDASVTMSRSVSQPLHAVGGLLLRGGWEVNTFNDALVEVVAGAIKSLVASLAESILHSVFSLVEIREVYAVPAKDERGDEYIWSWETRTRWGTKDEVVHQEVVLGSGLPDQPDGLRSLLAGKLRDEIQGDKKKKGNELLKNVLRDYATYRELALISREPDLSDEAITVSLSRAGDGLDVEASFSEPQADPGVVLRAYAGGEVKVMLPPENGVYRAHLDDASAGLKVHVLAGQAQHGCASLVA